MIENAFITKDLNETTHLTWLVSFSVNDYFIVLSNFLKS